MGMQACGMRVWRCPRWGTTRRTVAVMYMPRVALINMIQECSVVVVVVVVVIL